MANKDWQVALVVYQNQRGILLMQMGISEWKLTAPNGKSHTFYTNPNEKLSEVKREANRHLEVYDLG